MADYIFLLETRLSADQLAVAQYVQTICRRESFNLYLIGGPMRDMLAGQPVRVLDFSVEGNPLKLQKTLQADHVELLYADEDEQSLRLRMRGVRFRLTAAHAEVFEQPGKPATIRPATIHEDLLRRGFTLDAIALSLNENSRGLLRDPTNGVADIEARQIRMIHNYVFLEDPVRLLRAVRLRTRLGFEIEERTQARMEAAKEGNYLEKASRLSLARELEALAYEPDPPAVLKALEKEGLLEAAFGKGVHTNRMDLAGFAKLPKAVEQLEEAGITADSGPVALQFILGGLPEKEQARLAKLPLSRPLVAGWQRLVQESKHLERLLVGREGNTLASEHELLHRVPGEVVLYSCIAGTNQRASKKLKDFITRIPQLKQRLPIRELQQIGGKPGSPEFERVIQALYQQMLDGKLRTDAELTKALHSEAEKAGAIPRPRAKEKEKEPEKTRTKPVPRARETKAAGRKRRTG